MGRNPLAELGLSDPDLLAGGESGPMQLEHSLILSISSTVEESIRHTLQIISNSSKETTRTIKIVGYAAAAYLVCAGVAKIIVASRKPPPASQSSSSSSSSQESNV